MLRLLVLMACPSLFLEGQTRRALVIGIDEYQTAVIAAAPPQALVERPSSRQPAKVARLPARGQGRGIWANLAGAYADASNYRQILIDRYGFAPGQVIFLTDKKHARTLSEVATAQRILDTFQSHLIEAAKPGDISVFVFAGHGSRMRNEGSDEADKMDQTLVPADSENGVPDIRDKELARLYRKAAEKRILLTVIADSCHSGGVSRGLGRPAITRDAVPDPHVVNDPPDIDPKTGKPYTDPAESGYVLVISAALDNQAAEELEERGQRRGVFSYFFQRCLTEEPANRPIEQIFARTVALMRAGGRMQIPGIEGKGRRQNSLLGTAASSTTGISAAVQEVREGRIVLRGGLSLGLQRGCELVSGGERNGTRLRVIEPPDLSTAVTQVVSGPAPRPGEIFVLDRWTMPADLATRFFMPAAALPSMRELRATAAAIRQAAKDRHWVQDPTTDAPEIIVRFENGNWELERRTPAIERRSLGPSPSAAAWAAVLGGPDQSRLFVDFPPPKEFAETFKARKAAGAYAVTYVERRQEALYQLAGRLTDNGEGIDFEYAWLLANTDQRDAGDTPLPIRTDWFAASDADSAAQLEQRTLNLARLRMWLQLSVPGGGANPFPYSVALRNQKTGEAKTGGRLTEGESYDLVLLTTPDRLSTASASAMPQWVYVVAIDQKGRMRPIFPRQSINTSANRLPRDGSPAEIVLRTGIPVSAPFGTDTLILLTSEEEIDPAALQIDPVLTRGSQGMGRKGSVSELLFRMQGASRGLEAAPSTWGIERVTFRSVERPKDNQ